MKKSIFAALTVLSVLPSSLFAGTPDPEGAVLNFSDGRPSLRGLAEINAVLGTVGVHLSRMALPDRARPLLEASARAPLTDAQQRELLEMFALSKEDVLEQIRLAGRQPVLPSGGSMATRESGVPPYPKVYDLKSMSDSDRVAARDKFARLHVNATEAGRLDFQGPCLTASRTRPGSPRTQLEPRQLLIERDRIVPYPEASRVVDGICHRGRGAADAELTDTHRFHR
jgi:hypothetical protein